MFIAGDMVMFGMFFLTFLYYRGIDPALFAEGQVNLNQTIGIVNTLLLLSSSWLVAKGVHAARTGDARKLTMLVLGAVGCGLGFIALKVIEYSEKIASGFVVNTNDFYILYYMFTGIHLLHVFIGVGVLIFVVARSRRQAQLPIGLIESGASFWHIVDVLWIVLFALFYLLP